MDSTKKTSEDFQKFFYTQKDGGKGDDVKSRRNDEIRKIKFFAPTLKGGIL